MNPHTDPGISVNGRTSSLFNVIFFSIIVPLDVGLGQAEQTRIVTKLITFTNSSRSFSLLPSREKWETVLPCKNVLRHQVPLSTLNIHRARGYYIIMGSEDVRFFPIVRKVLLIVAS